MQNHLQERIAERAHRLWVEEGQPEGQQDHHWHRAEAEIAAEDTARAPAAGMGEPQGDDRGLPSDPPPPGEAPTRPVGGPGGATGRKG